MKNLFFLLGLCVFAGAALGCSQSKPVTETQATYIAVDATKYKTSEDMKAAIEIAKTSCSSLETLPSSNTGRTAVSTVQANADEMNSANVDACMAEQGFLRQN